MERCTQCGDYRKHIKDGLCLFCRHGPGGKSTEKKVDPNFRYATGKAIKSAEIEK